MRTLFFLIVIIAFGTQSNAQCYPDRHNSSWYDSWVSCETTFNPNPERGKSHWIQYDFGQTFALGELQMWNINAPKYLDYGIETAVIDYSVDGETWTEFGTISMDKGSGVNTYEGEIVTNFDGIEARYLIITALTSYGNGNCMGFAEFKVEADSVETKSPETCIQASVYPNPVFGNQVFVKLTQQCTDNISYKLIDPMGKVVIDANPIKLNETIEILKGRKLASGVYYLILFSNLANASTEYKIVIS